MPKMIGRCTKSRSVVLSCHGHAIRRNYVSWSLISRCCNGVSWSFSKSSLESHFLVVCANSEMAYARFDFE